jgi:hypothetical protein
MSMMRTLKRNQGRSMLEREVRKAQGKPVGTSRNKLAQKWERVRLKRSRAARLIVGLLQRATGVYCPPLELQQRVLTVHQRNAQTAETICREFGLLRGTE